MSITSSRVLCSQNSRSKYEIFKSCAPTAIPGRAHGIRPIGGSRPRVTRKPARPSRLIPRLQGATAGPLQRRGENPDMGANRVTSSGAQSPMRPAGQSKGTPPSTESVGLSAPRSDRGHDRRTGRHKGEGGLIPEQPLFFRPTLAPATAAPLDLGRTLERERRAFRTTDHRPTTSPPEALTGAPPLLRTPEPNCREMFPGVANSSLCCTATRDLRRIGQLLTRYRYV